VKKLAGQVGHAAQDITNQISGIQGQTERAVGTITSITGTIRKMNSISTAIAAAVEEQSTATREISRSIQETAAGTSEVTRHIEGVTQSAAQTGEASGALLTTAKQLDTEAETLRKAVVAFLEHARQA